MKLYRIDETLVVAHSKREARQLFMDHYGATGTPREVTKPISLSLDNGDTYSLYEPADVAVGKPHIIPEAG